MMLFEDSSKSYVGFGNRLDQTAGSSIWMFRSTPTCRSSSASDLGVQHATRVRVGRRDQDRGRLKLSLPSSFSIAFAFSLSGVCDG